MRLEVTGKIQKAEIQKKLCRRKDKGHRRGQRKTEKRARGSEPDSRDWAGTAQEMLGRETGQMHK